MSGDDPAGTAPPARPVLRVIRGDATPEEIAAILAVVAVASRGAGEDDESAQMWSAHGYAHRNIRATFTPSRDGWRTSFWPR